MALSSFAFNEDFEPQARVILSLASIGGFMIGGILCGAAMWVTMGRPLRERLANNPVEPTVGRPPETHC